MTEVSQLLSAVQQGDRHAADELLPLVYAELRRLAAQRLAHESPGQTLQPTALVHEAYLRLVGNEGEGSEAGNGAVGSKRWTGRGHFFAAAAEAMRRILIESARRKKRLRHGGVMHRVPLDGNDVAEVAQRPPEELLALDEALVKLTSEDPEAAEVVKLRFYAGLSSAEAADVLGISRAGAYRHWTYARAWLRDVLTRPA
jgi:RNA polymerase sigma factor (TIGR02999 family)